MEFEVDVFELGLGRAPVMGPLVVLEDVLPVQIVHGGLGQLLQR